jgi:hypothetical protein
MQVYDWPVRLDTSAPGDQVVDQYDYRDHDQNVDQAATDMEGESQEPQNEENYKDCPKHDCSFAMRAPGISACLPGTRHALTIDY